MSEVRKARHDPEDDYSGMVIDGPAMGQWVSHWSRTLAIRHFPPVRLSPSRLDLADREEMNLFYRYVDPTGDGEGGVWKLTDESRLVWGS